MEDKSNSSISNEDLIIQVAEGDKVAFSLLYDRFSRTVYILAAHTIGTSDAEEALQEIFLRLWNQAHQFDENRGEFKHWFMAIARNYLRDKLRKRNKENQLFVSNEIYHLLSDIIPDSKIPVEEEVIGRERSEVLLNALQKLPDEQRRVILLAYFNGLSQSAIANQLNLPLGTVKKRIKLGMEKLRRSVFNLVPQIEEKPEQDE